MGIIEISMANKLIENNEVCLWNMDSGVSRREEEREKVKDRCATYVKELKSLWIYDALAVKRLMRFFLLSNMFDGLVVALVE